MASLLSTRESLCCVFQESDEGETDSKHQKKSRYPENVRLVPFSRGWALESVCQRLNNQVDSRRISQDSEELGVNDPIDLKTLCWRHSKEGV
jgi:hypothetical protein